MEKLAEFQEAALRHALHFPALQRLVFSTCSVHRRENEDVIAAVLPFARELGFRLMDPFPGWHRRGLKVVAAAEKLIRVDPQADQTDGFFIAVFQRTKPSPKAKPTARRSHEDSVLPISTDKTNRRQHARAAAGRPPQQTTVKQKSTPQDAATPVPPSHKKHKKKPIPTQ